MTTEEAREAAFMKALEALDWKTLTTEDMVGFIVGAVDQSKAAGVASGIRQAREAVETVPVTQSRNAAVAAIDALGGEQ